MAFILTLMIYYGDVPSEELSFEKSFVLRSEAEKLHSGVVEESLLFMMMEGIGTNALKLGVMEVEFMLKKVEE